MGRPTPLTGRGCCGSTHGPHPQGGQVTFQGRVNGLGTSFVVPRWPLEASRKFKKKIKKSVGHLAANTPRDNHQLHPLAWIMPYYAPATASRAYIANLDILDRHGRSGYLLRPPAHAQCRHRHLGADVGSSPWPFWPARSRRGVALAHARLGPGRWASSGGGG